MNGVALGACKRDSYALGAVDENSGDSFERFFMRNLRVGYILDDSDQPSTVWDLIQKSKEAKNYSIELLIVQKTFKAQSNSRVIRLIGCWKKYGAKKFLELVGFALITYLEKLIPTHNLKYASFYDKYALEKIQLEKLYVNPDVSKNGSVYRYSDDDLEKIKEKNLDVLIHGGGGVLRGKILNICRFGILSFHYANNDLNRGGPPGFWEVYNREPSTGFVIQRLLSEIAGGDVLFKGAIATSHFYILNRMRLYLKANVFLHLLLERLAVHESLSSIYPKTPYSFPTYTTPSISQQFRYILKTFFHLTDKLVRKIQGKSLRWGVAYQFVDNWKSAVLSRSMIIKNPPNRFFADPFVVSNGQSHICYVEDYDYSISRAKITAFELSKHGYKELGTALKEDFHLSYPFIFEASGELFMCPEIQESREIRLYKCVNFPLNWTLHKVLMTGVGATDTSIFQHGNKWWMLTNIDSSNLEDYGSELHLFYSDTYDSTDWKPHPLNPVIFDSKRARNGGLLFNADGVYRVFQVQGFDLYGESMGISRITELTTETYKEEVLCSISPRFFNGICGTHTYSFNGGVLALDFVKLEKHRI